MKHGETLNHNQQRMTTMTTFTQSLGILTLSLVCGILSTGCRSMGEPTSASFASVTISGRSVEQIRNTAKAVFQADGYETFTFGNELVFEKEGTRGNTLAYDGLIATQSGARSIVRVKSEVVDLGGGSHRLQCQAYVVSGAGDSFFEEEHRVANIRSKPYQNLLDEVAKRLKQP
jgi:hypothetical protein